MLSRRAVLVPLLLELLLLPLPTRIISNYIRHSGINIINLQKGRLTDKQAVTALRRRCNLFAVTARAHTERKRERDTERMR